jgi:hypothetical protein
MIDAAIKAYPAEKWILANAALWIADIPFDRKNYAKKSHKQALPSL